MVNQQDGLTFQVEAKRDGVPLKVFLSKLNGLLNALRELDSHLSPDHKRTVRWVIVQASYNSPLTVRIAPAPIRGRTPNRRVAKVYAEGVKTIETKGVAPSQFTPNILKLTKRVMRTKGEEGDQFTIYADDEDKVRSSTRLIESIGGILRKHSYKDYSTIEGNLDAVNIHEAKPEFLIYDRLTDFATRCFFDSTQTSGALKALGTRVALTGLITYNRNDDPVAIEVDEMGHFRDPSTLPLFLEGEQINITGGLDSVEYVRRDRDAE